MSFKSFTAKPELNTANKTKLTWITLSKLVISVTSEIIIYIYK